MTKQIFSALKVSALALALSFGMSYVYAWTAPTTTPPGGNVSAPINTSGTAQTKTGNLSVGNLCLSGTCKSTWPAPGGSGTVTSLSAGTGITLSPNPITTIGTIYNTGVTSYNGLTGAVSYTYSPTDTLATVVARGNSAASNIVVNGINVGTGADTNPNIGNTALGQDALRYNNGGGYYGTAIGLRSLYNNWSGVGNTAVGIQSLYSNSSGSYNTAVGFSADGGSSGGSYNTVIGYGAGTPGSSSLTNATAIGNGAAVDVSNKVRIGNTSVSVIGGQVAWSNLSDKRLKEDVTDYTHGLDFITKLRPVSFKFISDATHMIHNGFIAQEVEATGIPFYGINKPATKDGYYSLSYAEFVVPLVNSVKELKAENDKLKADNEALLLRIEAIEAKLK